MIIPFNYQSFDSNISILLVNRAITAARMLGYIVTAIELGAKEIEYAKHITYIGNKFDFMLRDEILKGLNIELIESDKESVFNLIVLEDLDDFI
jgi:hypothetical protein